MSSKHQRTGTLVVSLARAARLCCCCAAAARSGIWREQHRTVDSAGARRRRFADHQDDGSIDTLVLAAEQPPLPWLARDLSPHPRWVWPRAGRPRTTAGHLRRSIMAGPIRAGDDPGRWEATRGCGSDQVSIRLMGFPAGLQPPSFAASQPGAPASPEYQQRQHSPALARARRGSLSTSRLALGAACFLHSRG